MDGDCGGGSQLVNVVSARKEEGAHHFARNTNLFDHNTVEQMTHEAMGSPGAAHACESIGLTSGCQCQKARPAMHAHQKVVCMAC